MKKIEFMVVNSTLKHHYSVHSSAPSILKPQV